MGRQEGCDVACTEHKLVLVRAADYDELLRAGQAARQLAAVARRFADADAQPSDPRDALLTLRADARRALLEAQAAGDGADWACAGRRHGLVVRAMRERRPAPAVPGRLHLAAGGLGQRRPL